MIELKSLLDLLENTVYRQVNGPDDIYIRDVTADSRAVREGSLFFCLSGAKVDGHDFAEAAIKKGAVAIVAEKKIKIPTGTTVIYVESTRKAMEDMVPYFFDYPSRKMRMVAVTGTNGKTTTTHIISHIFRTAGYKTGVIGTIHALIGDREVPTHNTTPDVIDLQRLLYEMAEEKVEYVCMEVSSHALALGRVFGCEFDTAVFTNLTEDHLDYHKTMENYAKAKAILFSMVSAAGQLKKNKTAWINQDDEYSDVMESAIQNKKICTCHTYGMTDKSDLRIFSTEFTSKKSAFRLKFDNKEYLVNTKLAGRFNIYNCVAAAGVALSEGLPVEIIVRALETFQSVPGRFELIDEGQSFTVVVDYAHTPDGLEKILTTAREISHGRGITVFGCGGGRDKIKRPTVSYKLKRPIMGRIAAKYADIVIITNDNPRTENPLKIIEEVKAGVMDESDKKPFLQYETEPDRRKAIRKAISLAEEKDVVIIAGKGHENYQILGNRTIHFDDREEARMALRG